ncbi:SprT-like domain-containing protein [Flavicella sediminum]|uniref:SprT-like domain-containing protein n=1 Tax=Flavicella sediminum TaxID=2585141 RepID=UPI0011207332|nr:SprT-like domain-containing protein [Flavicella sediminum]
MKEIQNFIPETALPRVLELLEAHDFILKIVNKRATKHGDFRKLPSGKYQITINNSLNPHQFLLTLIHEIAHHVTHQKYGHVKPHGKEWKYTFKELMLPFVHPEVYPNNILPHLAKYLINPKASTDSDVHLSLALKQDSRDSDKNYIFELSPNDNFLLKKRKFKLLEKKRTRFLCLELATGKKYLINQNAEVLLIA